MNPKFLIIDAPKYYGNAVAWTLSQVQRLKNEGRKIIDIKPIVNNLNELLRIEVAVL